MVLESMRPRVASGQGERTLQGHRGLHDFDVSVDKGLRFCGHGRNAGGYLEKDLSRTIYLRTLASWSSYAFRKVLQKRVEIGAMAVYFERSANDLTLSSFSYVLMFLPTPQIRCSRKICVIA